MGIYGLVRDGGDGRPVGLLSAGVVLALALFGLGAPSTALAGEWCSDDPTPPCVVSAVRGGDPVTSSDPDWDISASQYSAEGSNNISWSVLAKAGDDPYELGAASLTEYWSVVINTGTVLPRVVFTRGDGVIVGRTVGVSSSVEVGGYPTPYAEGCDVGVWPWTCPVIPTTGRDALMGGEITDYGAWEDVAQRESMFGMDVSTNVEAISVPPEIENGPGGAPQLLLRLGNSHFERDGTTVFSGRVKLAIPKAFLATVYGIDEFGMIPDEPLAVAVSGSSAGSGSVSFAVTPADLRVEITGLTFSSRAVRLRVGKVQPTRPTNAKAKRSSATRAKVSFKKSLSRGSKIRKYEVQCTGKGFKQTRKAKRAKSPVTVKKLTTGKSYSCQVRATSKAGPGPWSKKTALKP